MQVLARKSPSRAKQGVARNASEPIPFPVPISGMVKRNFLRGIEGAELCENFLPSSRGWRVRGGSAVAALTDSPITAMGTFTSTVSRFFAATATDIFEITSLDPNNVATSVVTGQTSGDYSFQQIGASGADVLVAANGTDNAKSFDGVAWTDWAVTGLASNTITHVWKHQNRLFVIEKDSLSFWYLPTGNIAGPLTEFNLAGVVQKGGNLVFGATWSSDSGDGLDDRCVIVTSEGEAVVYQGFDPSNAPANWSLVGRYDIGTPLGKRAFVNIAGDLLVATVEGIIPMSAATVRDPEQLNLDAITQNIRPIWEFEVAQTASTPDLIKWPEENMLAVAFANSTRLLTMNLQTGAWAEQTGWQGTCLGVFERQLFVGRGSNEIVQLNTTGADLGAEFVARGIFGFADIGDPTQWKAAAKARASWISSFDLKFKLGILADYRIGFTAPPMANTFTSTNAKWDTGEQWDSGAQWAAPVEEESAGYISKWKSAHGSGFVLAPSIQITSTGTSPLNVELLSIDVMLQGGGVAG